MPAIMDDPSSPTIHRVSGATPYPDPDRPALPASIRPRQVTLRDRQTIATIVPFVTRDQVPASLLAYLSDQFAKEIEGGDTYPMIDPMPLDKFSAYWFQNFAGIMLLGQLDGPEDVLEGKDWSRECLGSFYIKPNYPGRSSHVCNAGFLVTDAARNRGVGRLMGETYLDWAPKLGYSYSVFNLVYETNVASCKIWDALGFKRIGRVKECGNLKSYPDRLIDAIIYGRDLGTGAADGGDPLLVSEERFDKIKFYLQYGRYPNGSDRAEKSRLRSAATHYKLLDNDVLMLKGKEVIGDPGRQMAIARKIHEAGGHAGINKTTATIAEKFHWSRIKETVSDVIKTCDQCKDLGKTSSVHIQNQNQNQNQNLNVSRRSNVNDTSSPAPSSSDLSPPTVPPGPASVEATGRILGFQATPVHHVPHHDVPSLVVPPNPYAHPSDISSLLNPPLPNPSDAGMQHHAHPHSHHPLLHDQSHHESAATLASLHGDAEMYQPIDPHIISQPPPHHQPSHHHAFDPFNPRDAVPHHPDTHPPHPSHPGHEPTYSPHLSHAVLSGHEAAAYSPHAAHAAVPIPSHDGSFPHAHTHTNTHAYAHHHHHHDTGPHHAEPEPEESFQALLHEDDDGGIDHEASSHHDPSSHHHPQHHHQDHEPDQDAVDRDLDMLIEHRDDDDDDSEMDVDVGEIAAVAVGGQRGMGDDDAEKPVVGAGGDVGVDGDGDGNGSDSRVHAMGDGGMGKRSSIYDVVFDTPG